MDREQFTNKLSQNPRPVVVDFWAPWCMPCRAIEPVIKQLEQKYSGQVDVWKVNADESASLLQSLGVRGIPTVIAFRNGQEISRSIGARSPAALENLFTAALGGDTPPARGIAPTSRMLRLIASAALLVLGLSTGPSWLLIGVAGLVFFSAVYDRCPIWQALSPRLARLARQLRPSREQT